MYNDLPRIKWSIEILWYKCEEKAKKNHHDSKGKKNHTNQAERVIGLNFEKQGGKKKREG